MRKLDYIQGKWRCKKICTITKMENWLKNADIYNKKIKDIILLGDDVYLSYEDFFEFYANMKWKQGFIVGPWDNFEISYIPDNEQKARILRVHEPIILLFEDGTTFEFSVNEREVFFVSENRIYPYLKRKPAVNIDASKMFSKIFGSKIVDFRIKNTKYGYHETTKGRQKNRIKQIELVLDDGREIRISYEVFLLQVKEGMTDIIDIGEYKSCIYDLDSMKRSNIEKKTLKPKIFR